MSIETLAFSSSASGLQALGQQLLSGTCTLTLHPPAGADRKAPNWSAAVGIALPAGEGSTASAGASALRRRSLTLTF